MANFNGSSGGSRVWEFRNGSASWITWSTGFTSPTPSAGTAAAAWATLKPCFDLAPSVMFDKVTAANIAKLLRRIRRDQGLAILTDRDFAGSGPLRPAGGERSVRALARRLGVTWRQAAKFADSSDFNDCDDDAAS